MAYSKLPQFSWSSTAVAAAAGVGAASVAFLFLRQYRSANVAERQLLSQSDKTVTNVLIGTPQWISSQAHGVCRLWYKVCTGRNQHVYIFAEVSLVDGKVQSSRRPLFDHEKLSAALSRQGDEEKKTVDPKALALEEVTVEPADEENEMDNFSKPERLLWLVFTFQGRSWRWGPLSRHGESAHLTERAGKSAGSKTLRSLQKSHQQSHGGSRQVKVTFENKTSVELELVWMSYDGVPTPYTRIKPGDRLVQATYDGHVWLLARADAAQPDSKDAKDHNANGDSSDDDGTGSSSSNGQSDQVGRSVSWAQKRFEEGWLGTYEAEAEDTVVQIDESVLAGIWPNQEGCSEDSLNDEGARGTSSLHTEHVLMRLRPLYGGGRWICDNCGAEFAGASWHCALCTFDLCKCCFTKNGKLRNDLPRFPVEQLPKGKDIRVSWASDGRHAAWVEDRNVRILECEAMSAEVGDSENAGAVSGTHGHKAKKCVADESQAKSFTLTTDGSDGEQYEDTVLKWAPDSSALIALKVRKPDKMRRLQFVESFPQKQFHAKLRDVGKYLKPGDPLPRPKLVIFQCSRPTEANEGSATLTLTKSDASTPRAGLTAEAIQKGWTRVDVSGSLFPDAFTEDGDLQVKWTPNSEELFVNYIARDRQLFRVVACTRHSGEERTVWEEHTSKPSRSFIDCTNDKQWWCWLHKGKDVLYLSESDGWCHLYMRSTKSGPDVAPRQLTQGSWVVRKIVKVDEDREEKGEGLQGAAQCRGVWFMASGCVLGHDPYYLHLCWVPLDVEGCRVEVLTKDADGTHQVDLSPCKRFFVDTWSRVDLPPVTQLRDARTGAVILELEQGDASKLLKSGYSPPVRFSSAGRDGETQIHGVVFQPPSAGIFRQSRYRVVEEIYAGPHGARCPKSWSAGLDQRDAHRLAAAGVCVVILDGMGTNFRGCQFLDVAWRALDDQGFPDRKSWIRAAAAKFPWMDLSDGIGIFGGSAGGQAAMRALLDHGDLYKVAVADCGCHDNRIDKIWWNEQWMGPDTQHECYKRASNVVQANKLKDSQNLLLVVGELDRNVDPSSTFRVVGALQQAGKLNFELCVIVGQGHGAADTEYGRKRRQDFLMKHLQPRMSWFEWLASCRIQLS